MNLIVSIISHDNSLNQLNQPFVREQDFCGISVDHLESMFLNGSIWSVKIM